MPRRLPRYCVEDTDRHGNIRIYVRRAGRPKVRIHGFPWTPEFMDAYAAALEAEPEKRVRLTVAATGTWRWLCGEYLASPAFAALDEVTTRRRRALLEATYDEPTKPGSDITFGAVPVSRLTSEAIAVLRDRKASRKHGANNRMKAIRAVFKWAVRPDVKKASTNPARDVSFIQARSDGFHTWTIAEVERFLVRHPVGSKACLAMALLLFVGGRRSDVVALGPQHVSGDGWIRYTQHKNRRHAPVTLEVPLLPALDAAISACPSGHLTFLTTEYGKPFTSNGFGNWFKARCIEAGLPHCSAHGLRKAGATIAAENGATVHQLMAMYGWRTPQMPLHYTRKAEQKRLAGDAMHLISLARIVPLPKAVGQSGKKST